ncbi:HAD-IIB family hydrolase, partial [Caminibacter sp.]
MIFVSDLDKTLLRSDLSISEFTKYVWNSFKYPLTIATARSYTGVKNLLKDLKLNYPLVVLDGAMVVDSDGKPIRVNAIDKKLASEIIGEVYKNFKDYPLIVGFDEVGDEKFLYPKKPNKFQLELLEMYKNDSRLFMDLRALSHNLKMVYLGKKELLEAIEQFVKKFGVETKLTKDVYMNCYFLTLLHPLGDKAHGLKVLEEIMEIEPKEVSVFGDSINDIGMFEWAGTSIAVKNALEEVKKRADIVLPHTN